MELLDRLARFIPPPRRHLRCYHGVFTQHSALRARVIARIYQVDPRPAIRRRKVGRQ